MSMGGGDQNLQGRGNNIVPMIIDSVPVSVGHHNNRHGNGGITSGGATSSGGDNDNNNNVATIMMR